MKTRKYRTAFRRYFICPVLAMVFMMTAATVHASSNDAAVQIPVKQTFTVKQGTAPDGGNVFYYELTSQQKDNPMPEGSKDGIYTFSMKATQEGNLQEITYHKIGDYEYQIKQITDKEQEGYGYDKKTYTVVVSIRNRKDGGLYADLILKNEAGEKVENATFENTYTGKKVSVTTGVNKTPTNYTTPSSKISSLVKTGDETKLFLFVGLLAGSLLMLVVAAGMKKRKKGDA